jgi:hypothetical protein
MITTDPELLAMLRAIWPRISENQIVSRAEEINGRDSNGNRIYVTLNATLSSHDFLQILTWHRAQVAAARAEEKTSLQETIAELRMQLAQAYHLAVSVADARDAALDEAAFIADGHAERVTIGGNFVIGEDIRALKRSPAP